MENQELLLLEIEEFNRSQQADSKLTQNLENFIEYVAKTGTYVFPWSKIKKIYLTKTQTVIDLFNQISNMDALPMIPNFENIKFLELKERILDRMKSFTSAPFTIQRLSELLLKPQLNYSRTDKFLRGLEKCVMVVTTVDPLGNKIFTDLPIINGELNGNGADYDVKQQLPLITLLNLPPPVPHQEPTTIQNTENDMEIKTEETSSDAVTNGDSKHDEVDEENIVLKSENDENEIEMKKDDDDEPTVTEPPQRDNAVAETSPKDDTNSEMVKSENVTVEVAEEKQQEQVAKEQSTVEEDTAVDEVKTDV